MALRIIKKISQLCLAYSWLTSHHVSFALPSIIGSKSSLRFSPTSRKTLRMPNVSVPFGHKIRASFSSRPHFSLTWSSCISAEYRFWNQLKKKDLTFSTRGWAYWAPKAPLCGSFNLHLFPDFREFWFLEKTTLCENRIIGTVLMFQLKLNSPTSMYIS